MVLFLQRPGVPSGRPALCAKRRQARPLLFPKTTSASGLCEEGRGLKKLASQPFPSLASSSRKEGAEDGSQGVKSKAASSRACQPPGRKQPRRAQNASRDPQSDNRCHSDIQEFSRETRTGMILNRTGSLSQVSSLFFFLFSEQKLVLFLKREGEKKKKNVIYASEVPLPSSRLRLPALRFSRRTMDSAAVQTEGLGQALSKQGRSQRPDPPSIRGGSAGPTPASPP